MGWLSGGTLLVNPRWTARKAAAYVRGDLPEKDAAFEGDTLMCKHCGFHWILQPGSGIKRSWCASCAGPLCARHPRCEYPCGGQLHFMKAIERMEAKGRWLACILGG